MRRAERVIWMVWTMVATSLAPLWLIALLHPKLRLSIKERLGLMRKREAERTVIWHAASAGDVRAVTPVIQRISKRHPNWRLITTVQTTSGREMAKRLLKGVEIYALPLEGWPWTDFFLNRTQPDVLVTEYLELWPRLLIGARRRGARLVLQNGRLDPEKMSRYRAWYCAPWRGLLDLFELISARSMEDQSRFAALGVEAKWAHPHTKHAETSVIETLRGKREGKLRWSNEAEVWIAGSFHADEVSAIVRALPLVKARRPAIQALLVPRYPNLSAEVIRALDEAGVSARRWSDLEGEEAQEVDAVVVDVIGVLAKLYGQAHVAFVGGTLGARGGQNPIEPYLAGCQLVLGPSTRNIDAELGWLPETRLFRVDDESALADGILEALSLPRMEGGGDEEVVVAAKRAAAQLARRIEALALEKSKKSTLA